MSSSDRLRTAPSELGRFLASCRGAFLGDLLQRWGLAEKALWPGPDQAAIPNRPATKAA